jgi:hypothetical protein
MLAAHALRAHVVATDHVHRYAARAQRRRSTWRSDNGHRATPLGADKNGFAYYEQLPDRATSAFSRVLRPISQRRLGLFAV